MGYSKNAIAGFSWQNIQKGFVFALNFGKIFILARLLTPEDFGLFSLTMIAIGITESFTQTGVNTTIVQSKRSVSYFLDTAWVIAILRGFAIGILMILLGFAMQRYYGEEMLLPLVGVAALIPVIKGFINPAIVKWQKNFHFAQDSFYHALHLIVESLAQITLAIWFHSVWALVLGVIVGAISEVLISFLMNKERPRFVFYKSRGEVILKNAPWLSSASLLSYLNDNLDDFIIGKIAGTKQLGIYHNAYSLSHKANYELSRSAHHGLMPIFSKMDIKKEQARLKRAFRKSLFGTLLIGLLISLPLMIWPEFFVNLVLGEQWLSAVSILPILVLAGLIHSVGNITYALLIGQKKYRTMNIHLLLSLCLMLLGIIVLGNNYGLIGACWGIALGRFLSLPILIWGAKKTLT